MHVVHDEVDRYLDRVPGNQDAMRDDLLSAGYLAICLAARRWIPGREASFATFARRRIKGELCDEVIRLTGATRRQWRTYRDLSAEAAGTGMSWDAPEISERLGVSRERVERASTGMDLSRVEEYPDTQTIEDSAPVDHDYGCDAFDAEIWENVATGRRTVEEETRRVGLCPQMIDAIVRGVAARARRCVSQ